MFDTLNWSTSRRNEGYLFETPSLGWDYDLIKGCGRSVSFDQNFFPVFMEGDGSTTVSVDLGNHGEGLGWDLYITDHRTRIIDGE